MYATPQPPARTPASRPEPALLPPVDVIEDATGITLLADLPGVPKDRLALRVEGDQLAIEAEAVLAEARANAARSRDLAAKGFVSPQAATQTATLEQTAAARLAVPQGMEPGHVEVGLPRYRRTFTLSKELDADKVSAELAQGVLRVRIPKAEHAQPRRISVQVG